MCHFDNFRGVWDIFHMYNPIMHYKAHITLIVHNLDQSYEYGYQQSSTDRNSIMNRHIIDTHTHAE